MSIFSYQALIGLQLSERTVLDLMPKLEMVTFDIGQDIAGEGG